MRLGGTFVGGMFLFSGVHAVVSYVAVLFVFCRDWGALGVSPQGSPLGVFACPAQALLHAPWGYICGQHVSCSVECMLLSPVLLCRGRVLRGCSAVVNGVQGLRNAS